MNVNAEYVNPFLKAASSVFKSVVGVDLRRGKLVVKEKPIPSHDVAIIIGITGGVQGVVVYSLSMTMVYKIADILMPGLSKEQIDTEWKDIMGEFANMITGNAMNLFTDITQGTQQVNITTPTVVEGKEFTISAVQQTTLGINLYSPMGSLEMNVALK
ncbi:MAG: chemotaxis protein CheX [Spirochaetes bacterium]|nr:chemotaxis protein CheX [Spirochaetota bacterium]